MHIFKHSFDYLKIFFEGALNLKKLLRVISSAFFLIIIYFLKLNPIFYFIPYFIAGYDVLFEALEGIKEHEIFDECFLMALATIGALILGEYLEACAVMILYQTGELFGDYASDKTRENITKLMDIRPDYANIENSSGQVEKVNPSEIKKGSIIIVKPGEKFPIDGKIIEGHSSIDTKALTGESLPRDVNIGDEVLSGCVNLSGLLRIKTIKEFHDSAASKILDLVENASSRKSKSEKFITRFAKIYTPFVCICAVLLVIIPSIINPENFMTWFYRALTFLVISCPCALVISVPLTFFAAVGGAGKAGILIKGSNFIEALSKISSMVFDKTGTLTHGVFQVKAVHPDIRTENELLHLAAHVERYSSHPVADSLRKAYPNESDSCEVSEVEEIAGYGVKAKVNGEIICVGNSRFMEKIGADWHPCSRNSGTIIHIAINNIYAGHIVISDVVKENAKSAITQIKSLGINKIIMLTGDTHSSAQETAISLGIDEFYAQLLPSDKVMKLEEIMKSGKSAFVGDGINDAPVIARSDVGIAMGALGSDAAVEAADVVLMNDDPLKIPEAVRISRKCMSIVKENIVFTVSVKILCLLLGAFGIAGMWTAVFADVGVMILAVCNALRAMFVDENSYATILKNPTKI